MTFCTLEMAGRMVLRSEGGYPDAEYALFDAAEIELRALELGAIREVGYRTTVTDAIDRLTALGVTPRAREEAAAALRRAAEKHYARGTAAERAIALLGAAELFDGYLYNATARAYEGLWIDHDALARDLGIPNAGAILQAMGLASMLEECAPDAEVVLTTAEMMKGRRPGERSYRRIAFRGVDQVVGAIAELTDPAPQRERPRARSVLELVQSLRERPLPAQRFVDLEQALVGAKMATTPAFDDAFASFEAFGSPTAASVSPPDSPASAGSLAPPDSLPGAASLAASGSGAQPSLAPSGSVVPPSLVPSGSVAPSSLAPPSLAPPSLAPPSPNAPPPVPASSGSTAPRSPPARGPLAAPELWAIDTAITAGDLAGIPGRVEAVEKQLGRQPATIYLRSRVHFVLGSELPRVIGERLAVLAMTHPFPELEVLAAQAWLAAGDSARALPFARSVAHDPAAPSKLREIAEDMVAAIPDPSAVSAAHTGPPRSAAAYTSPPRSAAPMSGVGDARTVAPGGPRKTVPPPFGAPLPSDRDVNEETHSRPTPVESVEDVRVGLEFEWADLETPRPGGVSARSTVPTARPPAPSLTPPPSPAYGATEQAAEQLAFRRTHDNTSSSIPPALGYASGRAPELDSGSPAACTAPPPNTRHAAPASSALPLMKGASQPAYRSDVPPPLDIPRAPPLPTFEQRPPELAESLSLPPGSHGQAAPSEALPTTVLEARVQFTHLARELGKDYRERYGIELWTDLRGIETMQTILRDVFKTHSVDGPEEALVVRKHGAFLSEVLARTLGAEWVDIAPSDLGYWAMNVPPSTRVWPFGRLLRLIAMGTKERDLVSYYLELEARGRRRQ